MTGDSSNNATVDERPTNVPTEEVATVTSSGTSTGLLSEEILALTAGDDEDELLDDIAGAMNDEKADKKKEMSKSSGHRVVDDILKEANKHQHTTPTDASTVDVSSELSTATIPKTSLERGSGHGQPAKVGAVRVEGPGMTGRPTPDSEHFHADVAHAAAAPETAPINDGETIVPDAVLAKDVEEQVYNDIIAKAAVGEVVKENNKDKKTPWVGIIVACVIVLALIIGLSVGLTRKDANETNEALFNMVEQATVDAFGEEYSLILDNPQSPQSKALQWMSSFDEFTNDDTDNTTVMEAYAVSTLYFATGKSKVWSNANPRVLVDPDVCTWLKEDDHCQDGQVVVLDVSMYNLTGSLPDELIFLEVLQELDASQNMLTGKLPSGSLPSSLLAMNVSHNEYSGAIPSFDTNLFLLQTWDISHNPEVSSDIPASIYFLSALQDIRMDYVGLQGTRSEKIEKLSSLKVFSAEGTSLVGSFPSGFKDCQELAVLNLAESVNITGSFPYQMWSLPHLKTVNLKNVGLEVQLPNPTTSIEMIASISNPDMAVTDFYPKQLEELSLTAAELVGNIPSEIGYLTSLKKLGLDVIPTLTGTLPTEIAMLQELTSLDVSRSSAFDFTIPTEIGLMTNLEILWMFKTGLQGTIPSEIGGATNLRAFNAKISKLTTSIPTEIGHLTKLEIFEILLNTGIYGTIPTELGLLTNMVTLTSGGLNVTGTLPSELGNLEKMEKLIFANGQIGGTIPSTYGKMRSMVKFAIDKQQLTGTLPVTLSALSQMTSLDVKENLLTGTVPRFYADLTNLKALQIQGNSITGEINTYMCAGWNHSKVVADCDDLKRCACCSECCVDGMDCVEQEDYEASSGEDPGWFGGPPP